MKRNIDLSIIIPAYNEEKRIGYTLESLGRYFSKKNINVEILVVVNNTTDKTVDVVKQYQKEYAFIKYTNIRKAIGKGGAISVGFRKSLGKYILFLDADGASSPDQIMSIYNEAQNGDSDVVIGSRYLPNSEILGELPIYRIILSRAFNIVVRTLFGLNYYDTQCGLKIFKKEVAQLLSRRIISKKWTIDINLLLLCKYYGFKVNEVPTTWTERGGSTLKISKAFKEVFVEIAMLKRAELNKFINVKGGLLDTNPTLSYKALIR